MANMIDQPGKIWILTAMGIALAILVISGLLAVIIATLWERRRLRRGRAAMPDEEDHSYYGDEDDDQGAYFDEDDEDVDDEKHHSYLDEQERGPSYLGEENQGFSYLEQEDAYFDLDDGEEARETDRGYYHPHEAWGEKQDGPLEEQKVSMPLDDVLAEMDGCGYRHVGDGEDGDADNEVDTTDSFW